MEMLHLKHEDNIRLLGVQQLGVNKQHGVFVLIGGSYMMKFEWYLFC